jgi:hypothetical protein
MRLIFDIDLAPVTFGEADDFLRRPTLPQMIVIESLPFREGTFRLDVRRWLAQFQRWGEWGEGRVPAVPAEFWEATPDTLALEFPVTKVLGIKAPGKVEAVFWTIQRDVCSIQVSFPSVPQGEELPEHARVQVWLLESDGTAISPVHQGPVSILKSGWQTPSVIYAFPEFARTEAVAVVVRIDDEYHVEALTSERASEAP